MGTVRDFELRRPATLADALAAFASADVQADVQADAQTDVQANVQANLQADPGAHAAAEGSGAGPTGAAPRWLAGGTDLVPNLRRGIGAPARLIDISRLPELARFEAGREGLVLGAGLTLAQLAVMPLLRAANGPYRALAEAAEAVAGPAHRSAATLGGNLCQDTRCVYYNQSAWWRAANHHCLKLGGSVCHVAPSGKRCNAAFCSDMAAALLALGAEVELVARGGTRRLPLAALYRDDGALHLALAAGELLRAVHLRAPATGTVSGYLKGRVRGAMDFPLAGVAMALSLRAGRVTTIAVGLTGTDARPLLLQATEALAARAIDEAWLDELGKQVARQVSPARTTVMPSHHRRLLATALARKLAVRLAGEAVLGGGRTEAQPPAATG